MSFCSLIKGITLKICRLHFVLIYTVFMYLLRVWILSLSHLPFLVILTRYFISPLTPMMLCAHMHLCVLNDKYIYIYLCAYAAYMDVVYHCKAPTKALRAGAVELQVYHYSHYYRVQKLDADHRVGAVSSSNLVFFTQSTSVVISGRRRCKSVPLFSLLHSSKTGCGP